MQFKFKKGWNYMFEMESSLWFHFLNFFRYNDLEISKFEDKEDRFIGFDFVFYDGCHYCIGLGLFHVSSSP